MMDQATLLHIIDRYIAAASVPDVTASYRIFGDSKKIRHLRGTSDITLRRAIEAMDWLSDNWPEGASPPSALLNYQAERNDSSHAGKRVGCKAVGQPDTAANPPSGGAAS